MNMSKYARNLSDRQLLASEGMCRANSSEDEADYNAELEPLQWDSKVGLPYANLVCIKETKTGSPIIWNYHYTEKHLKKMFAAVQPQRKQDNVWRV